MSFQPYIEGELPCRASKAELIETLRRRVEAGLLGGQRGSRSNYTLLESSVETVDIRAVNWLTAINVGLNELTLDFSVPRRIRFELRYWRWAMFCLTLCGVLGSVGVALFLAIDIRGYIARNPNAQLPGLSIDQNVYLAWANLLFWGFFWPWILIWLHKRPLRRLLQRLIMEVDAAAAAGQDDVRALDG